MSCNQALMCSAHTRVIEQKRDIWNRAVASYPVCGTIPCFISPFFDTPSSKRGRSGTMHHKSPNIQRAGEDGRGTISWVTCQLFPPPLPSIFLPFFLYVAAHHKQRQPAAALSLTLFQSEPPGCISQRRRETHD